MRCIRSGLGASIATIILTVAAAEELTIKVREATLRAKPSHLGKVVKKVGFGQHVDVVEKKRVWYAVRHESDPGWLHKSALTERKSDFKPGKGRGTTGATKDEMIVAYRPFDEEVERKYRKENRSLAGAYDVLDRMEARPQPSPEVIADFLAAGGLEPPEGDS